MRCWTCRGLGTVDIGSGPSIRPRNLSRPRKGEVILTCPSCRGSGALESSEIRIEKEDPPALIRAAARVLAVADEPAPAR